MLFSRFRLASCGMWLTASGGRVGGGHSAHRQMKSSATRETGNGILTCDSSTAWSAASPITSPWSGRGRRCRDGLPVSFHLCVLPKRAVHPQCIGQIARIRRSWFHEPTDFVIRCTASSYTSVGGSAAIGLFKTSQPQVLPDAALAGGKEMGRGKTGGIPLFLSGKITCRPGKSAGAIPLISHPPPTPQDRLPAQMLRTTPESLKSSISPFSFSSEKRTQLALPSSHLGLGAYLSCNPRHTIRAEGNGD